MNVLLDTHALLWSIADKDKLSKNALKEFLEKENNLFLSPASLWEIGIKISLGKLKLTANWAETISKELSLNSIAILPIEITHCEVLEHLPFHHRDPFDRIIISQAMVESFAIMSRDSAFSKYNAKCIW